MFNVQGYQSATPALAQSSMYSQPATMSFSNRSDSMMLPKGGFEMSNGWGGGGLGEILNTVLNAVFEFVSQLISKFLGGASQPHILTTESSVAGAPTASESGENSTGGWLETGKQIFEGVKDIWGMFSGGEGGSSFLRTAAKFIGSLF